MTKKREIRKRAKRIKEIRNLRILNESTKRIAQIYGLLNSQFEFLKLKKVKNGYRYSFDDKNSIRVIRWDEVDDGAGSFTHYEFYINEDKLEGEYDAIKTFYDALKKHYKDSKETRINHMLKEITS